MLGKATMRLGLWTLLAVGAVAGCQCEDGLKAVSAEIEVTPNPVEVGQVAIGAVAETLVEVRNLGSGTLDVESISVVEGDDVISVTRLLAASCEGKARTDSPLSILPGGCATFAVRMLPKSTGPVAGLIRVTSDASNLSVVDVPVGGTGVKAAVRACVVSVESDTRGEGEGGGEAVEVETCTDFTQDPAVLPTVEFDDLPAGDIAEKTVRIYNDGEGSLTLTNARVETEKPVFYVEGDSFTGSVPAGSSIDVKVMFAPKSSGDFWGMLHLPTNDPEHALIKLPVVATGLGASLCMTPAIGVDFGAVPLNETRTQAITFENCGYIDYDIDTLDFTNDDKLNPKFSVKWVTIDGHDADAPEIPLAFPPGSQLFAEVTYAPQVVHGDEDTGDTGGFSIKTQYQSGRVPVRGKGASPGCNMGGPPTPLVRVTQAGVDITANPTSEPLKTVNLDASGSTVPGGGAKYQWRLVRQPLGGSISLSGSAATRPTVDLYLELAGEYEVELVVQDQYACAAPPVKVVIISKPSADLHIQLTWAERHGDVDLHLIREPGTFFNQSSDCFYYNCMPSNRWGPYSMRWGGNTSTTNPQNPTLDIDHTWGRGPENINVRKPADGTYTVQVHYYCSKQGFGSSLGKATPRIRIFVNGVVELDQSLSFSEKDMWTAATIVVSGGNVTSVTPSTSVRRVSQGC